MGYSNLPGWRVSLEYDYINQDELRSGTHAVSGVPDGNELEHDTLNRYVTAGVNYAPNSSWNVTLLVPYVIRDHSTYGTYDPTQPLPQLSTSHSSSLGDVRVIGAYQGFLPSRELGLQLGVKVPSGRYGTALDFDSGPSAGTPVDASLQPGSGSTDIILGAYYHHPVSLNFDLFGSVQFQSAVRHHMDQPGNDYRPGNSTTGIIGVRYEADARWVPQVQLNLLHKSPDQGALADVQSTAGTVFYAQSGDQRTSGRPATRLWIRAGAVLQQSVRVSAVSALHGERRAELCAVRRRRRHGRRAGYGQRWQGFCDCLGYTERPIIQRPAPCQKSCP